jgi:hypothetical protein
MSEEKMYSKSLKHTIATQPRRFFREKKTEMDSAREIALKQHFFLRRLETTSPALFNTVHTYMKDNNLTSSPSIENFHAIELHAKSVSPEHTASGNWLNLFFNTIKFLIDSKWIRRDGGTSTPQRSRCKCNCI